MLVTLSAAFALIFVCGLLLGQHATRKRDSDEWIEQMRGAVMAPSFRRVEITQSSDDEGAVTITRRPNVLRFPKGRARA